MLYFGEGTEKNHEQALYYFQLAAKNGVKLAILNIGIQSLCIFFCLIRLVYKFYNRVF